MSHQGGQESQPGYMDGVCVKISEKYKPPPRINLALTYSQRLSLNQQIQNNIQRYDFTLETNIKERMHDLRNMRKVMMENKRERLKAAKDKREETCKCKSTEVLYPSYSSILTPTPLVNINKSQSDTEKSPFNIAEFEADTSSPFDNMELKTINDIEELAQVLKSNKAYTNYMNVPTTSESVNYIPTTLYNNHNGLYYSNQSYTYNPIKTEPENISNITKTLQESCITNSTLDDIYDLLPKNLQQLSKNISLMGFPLSRVARACQALGDDQKKVVEHLLVMSDLLDLGFSETAVSNALIQCNNDRDKALDILIM